VLAQDFFKKHLALSGKSPAYRHCRKSSKSPRREIGCGLFRIAHLKTASR
jgi:hypothetical protein